MKPCLQSCRSRTSAVPAPTPSALRSKCAPLPSHSSQEKPLVFESSWKKEKDIVSKEIEKLRVSIQTLCRSALPLGKIMDYIQEDVDAMQNELQLWHAENQQHAEALQQEQRWGGGGGRGRQPRAASGGPAAGAEVVVGDWGRGGGREGKGVRDWERGGGDLWRTQPSQPSFLPPPPRKVHCFFIHNIMCISL